MAKNLIIAIKAVFVLSLLTGAVYPLIVTGFGQLLFTKEARGSLLARGDQIIGSSLISQKFNSERYFHSRPSAVDYGTVASGASNLSPTSQSLKDAVKTRRESLGPDAPADLLTTSASGLDPHISPEAVKFQMERIIDARNIPPERTADLEKLVGTLTEEPQWGFLGRSRVNVLLLNQALDDQFP